MPILGRLQLYSCRRSRCTRSTHLRCRGGPQIIIRRRFLSLDVEFTARRHQPGNVKSSQYLVRVFAVVVAVSAASSAIASPGVGIRGGITDDPDTFFLGIQAEFQIGRQPLVIEPSLDFGIGEGGADFFSLRGNLHFKYRIRVAPRQSVYPLFGPSLYLIHVDDCNGDCTRTDLGFDLGFGYSYSRFSIELGVGVWDVPDITLTLSYTF